MKEKKVILSFTYIYFFSEKLPFYTSYTFILLIQLSGEKKLKKLDKTQNHEVKENSHAFIREKFKSQILKLDMLFFKNFKSERKENKRCSSCITFLFQKGQGKNKPNKTRQDASLI